MGPATPTSWLVRHALGLGVSLLTIVPAYLTSRPNTPQAAQGVVSMAPGAADSAESATHEIMAVEIETHIREIAVRHGISPILVAAIVEAESEFNPRAVSGRGARGLMQLMPRTASSLQVEDTFDPYENLEGGVRHLRRLMDRFNDNLPLVLAAYNAGERAVLVYGGIPPYPETRHYVARILRRIGRWDLVRGVSSGASREVVPVGTSRIEPKRTWRIAEIRTAAVASPGRMDGPERQARERRAPAGLGRDSTAASRRDGSPVQGP
jgi:hypothetical protein